MGNFGFGEMAVIAIFGLLVFGPDRLPEIARSVGGFIREFKNVTGGITKEFKAEMDAAPRPKATPGAAISSGPGPEPAHDPLAENVTTN